MSWLAPLMHWIPALSRQPLGAVRDCLAFSAHLEGRLLVFRAGRVVGGESAGPGTGHEWRKPFCPDSCEEEWEHTPALRTRPPIPGGSSQ